VSGFVSESDAEAVAVAKARGGMGDMRRRINGVLVCQGGDDCTRLEERRGTDGAATRWGGKAEASMETW
jgi:hypothetical protein